MWQNHFFTVMSFEHIALSIEQINVFVVCTWDVFMLFVCFRLQIERDHLEQWLHAAEEKTAKEEDQSLLEGEALQQR